MIRLINKKYKSTNIMSFLIMLVSTIAFISCEENTLPEAGSVPDLTPPIASFSASESNGDWQTYNFSNESVSATDFTWDFGDGKSSTTKEPSNTYAAEGSYTVSLTASDKLGATSTFTSTIEVVEPLVPVTLLPEILEASFEDGMLDGGSGDGRGSWRNSELGGVIQITSSPVESGSQAAKFPSAGDRIAYQELEVSPNADYILTYFYTIKTSPVGSVTVAVLAGEGFTDPATIPAATIASEVGTDQASSNSYVKVDLEFNSGNNTKIAIYISNEGAEARVDSFSMVVK